LGLESWSWWWRGR